MLSLQADPRLHRGQYQNQPPPQPPTQQLQLLKLTPYGDDVLALRSDVAASASAPSSANVIKHSQPLDSREGYSFFFFTRD